MSFALWAKAFVSSMKQAASGATVGLLQGVS
jgi:hypothetical protein